MEMPANCRSCDFGDDEARFCKATKEFIPMLGKPWFCPLVELPEKHGRLIDADALPRYTGYALSAGEVATAVENAPTIVEAEGE